MKNTKVKRVWEQSIKIWIWLAKVWRQCFTDLKNGRTGAGHALRAGPIKKSGSSGQAIIRKARPGPRPGPWFRTTATLSWANASQRLIRLADLPIGNLPWIPPFLTWLSLPRPHITKPAMENRHQSLPAFWMGRTWHASGYNYSECFYAMFFVAYWRCDMTKTTSGTTFLENQPPRSSKKECTARRRSKLVIRGHVHSQRHSRKFGDEQQSFLVS